MFQTATMSPLHYIQSHPQILALIGEIWDALTSQQEALKPNVQVQKVSNCAGATEIAFQ
jgi:hypothetical protein